MMTIIAEDLPAGTTRINCPACRQGDVAADIIEHAEKLMESLVVHVSTHTTWWVVCSACQARLYSKLPGPELRGRTADQLVGVVVPRVPLVHQFLAVASIVLSITPVLGLGMAVLAYLLNRRSIGWPRVASKVGLGLSVLLHGLLAFIAVFADR